MNSSILKNRAIAFMSLGKTGFDSEPTTTTKSITYFWTDLITGITYWQCHTAWFVSFIHLSALSKGGDTVQTNTLVQFE